MMNNFLLQKAKCICKQISDMRPCGICGRTEYSPEVEAQRQAQKDAQEHQRQAF